MKPRLITPGRAITAASASLALLCAAPAPGGARSTQPIPDVTVLFGRAVQFVRHSDHHAFADAAVFEADGGIRGGGGASSARDVTSWRFVFDNQTPHSRYLSATVTYGPPPRRFGRVVGYEQPFLEDVVIKAAPGMTLPDALRRLRRAGYGGRFVAVTLRNPLGPRRANPQYIFGMAGGRYVSVDTKTGRVAPVS